LIATEKDGTISNIATTDSHPD